MMIYNGKMSSDIACIPSNDRGFTLGHGLFETILVVNNSIPALPYHWKRLTASAALIDIAIPFSYSALKAMIVKLITVNKLQDKLAGARLSLTQGEAERGILPAYPPAPNFIINVFECSPRKPHYSAMIVNTRKNEYSLTSKLKSLSYLDNILAKQEAVKLGYDEAILLNTSLSIADGSTSNIFMVKDQYIFTPKISDGALPGVIRSILFDELSPLFTIKEASLSVHDLYSAQEIFLTNALMGIQSLNQFNEKVLHSCQMADQIRSVLINKNYFPAENSHL